MVIKVGQHPPGLIYLGGSSSWAFNKRTGRSTRSPQGADSPSSHPFPSPPVMASRTGAAPLHQPRYKLLVFSRLRIWRLSPWSAGSLDPLRKWTGDSPPF